MTKPMPIETTFCFEIYKKKNLAKFLIFQNMKTFLLLLLPAFISAQWGESTTLPASSGECAAEIDKMVACLPVSSTQYQEIESLFSE